MDNKPNIVFVFSDQHRANATGYNGNPDVKTPNLDELKEQSVNFTSAVSGCPVCSPYRASLLTGQYPWKHGVFINDVPLDKDINSIGKVLKKEGYETAYIGKWHVDGHGRSNFIPRERRQGFDFWNVLECTHQYNDSNYYSDTPEIRTWEGYDAIAQTGCACDYILKKRENDGPFALFLSWGPPHDPYHTAPKEYKSLYEPEKIKLSPNVLPHTRNYAKESLAGYYAHVTALDSLVGDLVRTLKKAGIFDNTVFVYTSDHGDMLGCRGMDKKQKPWDESIMVPFLLSYPQEFGYEPRCFDTPMNAPDIMPTLLGLCKIPIPESVQGIDYAPFLREDNSPDIPGALLSNIKPFGEWQEQKGGREYRGIRTKRYTYVRDLNGPWLLYDSLEDPYQMKNLCNEEKHIELQQNLEKGLEHLLKKYGDDFQPGDAYMEKWGYELDGSGNITYTHEEVN